MPSPNSTAVAPIVFALLVGPACRPHARSPDADAMTLGDAATPAVRASDAGEATMTSRGPEKLAPCVAFEMLGPYSKATNACGALRESTECPAPGCRCRIVPAASSSPDVAVIEIGDSLPHGYALALRDRNDWYVSAAYPLVDSMEGGMEHVGIVLLANPLIETGGWPGLPGRDVVYLSLDRGICYWPKWGRGPSGPSTCPAVRSPGSGERMVALGCFARRGLRPACTAVCDGLPSSEADAGAVPCH
jgi:hypothetical protein